MDAFWLPIYSTLLPFFWQSKLAIITGMINKYKNFIFIAAEIILAVLFILSLIYVRGCVNAASKKVALTQGCSKEGEVIQNSCPDGQNGRIFEICKNGKYEETYNDCKASACSIVAFDQLSPLITQKCVSCHTGFDTYDVAKVKIDEMIRRINLDPANSQRMPKQPNDPLSKDEKALFQGWKDGGLTKNCPDSAQNANPHLDLNYVENSIETDLEALSSSDQVQARYLITSHKSDEGANTDVLGQFTNAVQKSINSLSFSRDIVAAKPIDTYHTVFRFLLRDLKLSEADWLLIEAADPVNFESFTNQGQLIKQLTKTRKPWFEVDSFAFTSNQASTYYAIRKLPSNLLNLYKQLGVNFDKELTDLTALFVGFANSPIALNKNRLLVRVDSNDGELYQTFDTDNTQISNDRNLFSFPLLKSASGNANFKFDASELIFSLPNGLHGYFLSDAKGNRLNAAALTIVADNISPFSPEIRTSLSCTRCHNGGYIHAKDEVKAHVDENAAFFSLDDVDFVDQLYRNPEPSFNGDNDSYAQSLSRMGIAVGDPDPINVAADNLRRNVNAEQVAALLLLTKQEFLDGLNRSAQGRQQIGSLLTGGEITFQQLQATLPILFKDLRIGVNPL